MSFYLDSNFNNELEGYEGLIEDGDRRMRFLFRPSGTPDSSRFLVILHGHGANKKYAGFKSADWSVLMPLDEYGTDGLGSWWLGENGDLFTFRLLQDLIRTLRQKYKFPPLYFWGSSMGGYGAILHGLASNAQAIFAHIPQTKLVGTNYTDENKKFFAPLANGLAGAGLPLPNSPNEHYAADLCQYLAKFNPKKSPVFFLSQNAFDYPHYVRQHLFPFVMKCDELGFAYSSKVHLVKGHKLSFNIAQSVQECFDKEQRKIRSWRINGVIE